MQRQGCPLLVAAMHAEEFSCWCRYDVSTVLTLSLTKKYEGWWAAMLARKAALTLQDCLQGYTQEETLPVRLPGFQLLSAML